jgi:hypothetical protein
MPPTPTIPCRVCGQLFKQETGRMLGCPDCMRLAAKEDERGLRQWFLGYAAGFSAGMSAERATSENSPFSRGFRAGVGYGRRYIAATWGW